MLIKKDQIKIRDIVAKSVGVRPDSIKMTEDNSESKNIIYLLMGFKGYDLATYFSEIPTIKEARDKIKDLYLCGVEWDFDEEMKTI